MALEHFDQGESSHSLSTWQRMHDESMHEYYHSHSSDMHDHNHNELFYDEEMARRKRDQDSSRRKDYMPKDGQAVQEFKVNEAVHENFQKRIFSTGDVPGVINDDRENERREEERVRSLEDEKRRQEDERRRQEDARRKEEEERRRKEDTQYGDSKPSEIAERRKQEDERTRQEEERRRQEDARRRAEDDRRRLEDERRLKRQEDLAFRNRPVDATPHHDYHKNETITPVYGASNVRTAGESAVKYTKETFAYAKDTAANVAETGKMVYREIDNITSTGHNYGIFKELSPQAMASNPVYSAASMAAGASMVLASTVAQIVNASRVDRAEREYAVMENRDSQKVTATQDVENRRSLAEYRESVDISKTIRDSGIQERKALTNSQIADVDRELKAVTKKYDSELKGYTERQTELQSAYKSATATYENRVSEIKQSRTTQITSIQENARQQMANQDRVHESRISRIESSSELSASDKAARIASENAAHQKEMTRIQADASRSITRVDQSISSQLAAEKKSFSKTTSSYNTNMQSLQKNIDGLQQTRTSACAALEQRKSTIMLEHKEAIKQLQADYNLSGEVAKTVRTGAEAATIALAAHSSSPSNTKLKGAAKLQDIALNNQRDIAQAAVELFGDDKQKQLVRAAIADSKAAAEAKKNNQVYISPLSQKDKNEAEKAMAKVGGMTALSSSKEVSKSLAALNQMMPQVQMQINNLVNEEKNLANKISGRQQQLAADNKALKESNQAQRMLKAGKDASGKELTADARKALNAKVLTKEQATALRNKLAAGQTSLNGLQTKMNELTTNKNALTALQSKMNKQKELLTKNGKIIANTNADKKLAFKAKQGRKTVSRSISNINKTLYNLGGGRKNGIDQAFNGNLYYDQQSRQLVHLVSTSARLMSVSLVATKMITQLTVKPIGMCISSSKIFQNVRNGLMSRYSTFAGNHKFLAKGMSGLGKGVGIVGGTVLRAPGFILKNAGKAVNYALNPDQALKDGARWAGRKAGNFVMKTTMNGVKKVTVPIGRAMGNGVRFAKGQVGKGARAVGRGTKKALGALYNKTLGKTKLGRAAANATSWAGKQVKKLSQMAMKGVKKVFGAAKKVLAAPFAFLKWIFGFLASILSMIAGMIMSAVGSLLIILVLIAIIVVILIVLLSIIMAIANFLDQFTADYQNKISNSPAYIANMGSNYRNTELMILEFFKDGSTENVYTGNDGGDAGQKHKIEVNDNPIYYAVFDNSFKWFGLVDSGKDINFQENGERVTNEQAENLYNRVWNDLVNAGYEPLSVSDSSLKHWWDYLLDLFRSAYQYLSYNFDNDGTFKGLDGRTKEDFKSVVTTYDNVSVSYFVGNKGDTGTYRSNYEVSNAKDVIAMMDATYTLDEDMQRVEVLKYLGVGDYQLQNRTGDQEEKRKMLYGEQVDNLFWDSHDIQYKTGTKSSDIKFGTTDRYGVYRPHVAQRSGDNYILPSCDNKSKMEIKYKVTVKEHADYSSCNGKLTKLVTNYLYVGGHNYCSHSRKVVYGDSYRHFFCPHGYEIVLSDSQWALVGYASTLYPEGYRLPYPDYVPDYSKPCPHTKPETRTMTMEYCLGHINLDVEIYVAVIDSDNQKNLMDIAAQLTPLSGKIGNGLWTWSEDLGIHGIGDSTIKPINPSEHWGPDGDARDLAEAKSKAEITYTGDDANSLGVIDSNGNVQILKVRRGELEGSPLLIQSTADNLLLFPFRLYGNEFFIPDMKSGEQKALISRPSPGSTAEEVISIKRSSTGTYYTKVSGS